MVYYWVFHTMGKLQGPHHDEDYEGELSKNSTYHGVCELVANENVLRNIPGTYQLHSISSDPIFIWVWVPRDEYA